MKIDWQRLTVERVTLIALFVMLFSLATRIPVDTDTWWHIRSGEYTLNEGFIYEDPFSHTRNDTVWINHSWGTQILLYGVYRVLGDAGLALYTALLATGGMIFVYKACAGNTYLRAFSVVLGAVTAAVFWSARPQMISFLFSTVILYILFSYKQHGKDYLWWIPPLMVVWGNLHAGFSIAFIFLAGTIAGEIAANVFNRGGDRVIPMRGIGKLIVVSLVSAALIMINPYGYRMLLVPFQTVGLDVLRNFIQEWQSPNFQEPFVLPFVALLLGTLGAVGANRGRIMWMDFILFSGTAFMALAAGRNIAVFAVVATPILTRHVDAMFDEQGWVMQPLKRVSPAAARLNLMLLALITIGAVGKIVYVLQPERVAEAQTMFLPVKVADYMAETQPVGMMFNSYNYGGYLMWALPEYPVFVDGRTDLYGDDFLNQYIGIAAAGDTWRDDLDEYGVNVVVVESESLLAKALRDEVEWMQDYDDDQAAVFVRDEPLDTDE